MVPIKQALDVLSVIIKTVEGVDSEVIVSFSQIESSEAGIESQFDIVSGYIVGSGHILQGIRIRSVGFGFAIKSDSDVLNTASGNTGSQLRIVHCETYFSPIQVIGNIVCSAVVVSLDDVVTLIEGDAIIRDHRSVLVEVEGNGRAGSGVSPDVLILKRERKLIYAGGESIVDISSIKGPGSHNVVSIDHYCRICDVHKGFRSSVLQHEPIGNGYRKGIHTVVHDQFANIIEAGNDRSIGFGAQHSYDVLGAGDTRDNCVIQDIVLAIHNHRNCVGAGKYLATEGITFGVHDKVDVVVSIHIHGINRNSYQPQVVGNVENIVHCLRHKHRSALGSILDAGEGFYPHIFDEGCVFGIDVHLHGGRHVLSQVVIYCGPATGYCGKQSCFTDDRNDRAVGGDFYHSVSGNGAVAHYVSDGIVNG